MYDQLRNPFVHADRGRRDPAAHKGNLCEFAEALNGSVLAVEAVQDRKYKVYLYAGNRGLLMNHEALFRRIR